MTSYLFTTTTYVPIYNAIARIFSQLELTIQEQDPLCKTNCMYYSENHNSIEVIGLVTDHLPRIDRCEALQIKHDR